MRKLIRASDEAKAAKTVPGHEVYNNPPNGSFYSPSLDATEGVMDRLFENKSVQSAVAISDDPIFNEVMAQLEERGLPTSICYDGVPELIYGYPQYGSGDLVGAVSAWIDDTLSNYPEFFDDSNIMCYVQSASAGVMDRLDQAFRKLSYEQYRSQDDALAAGQKIIRRYKTLQIDTASENIGEVENTLKGYGITETQQDIKYTIINQDGESVGTLCLRNRKSTGHTKGYSPSGSAPHDVWNVIYYKRWR